MQRQLNGKPEGEVREACLTEDFQILSKFSFAVPVCARVVSLLVLSPGEDGRFTVHEVASAVI